MLISETANIYTLKIYPYMHTNHLHDIVSHCLIYMTFICLTYIIYMTLVVLDYIYREWRGSYVAITTLLLGVRECITVLGFQTLYREWNNAKRTSRQLANNK